MDTALQVKLEERFQQSRYRTRTAVDSACAAILKVDGKPLHNFCSNDYLGLASHPEIARAFKQGIDRYGAGSGASHLISGHGQAHQYLEQQLADFTGRPRALLFSSGYMANLGVINGLVGRGDLVLEDYLNHASLLDGGLLSGARFQRFKHCDTADLNAKLSRAEGQRKLLVTDAVFSMDGDLAPLEDLAALCANHRSWLMVDDAHGFGVLGARGGGLVEHLNLTMEQVPILVGTLGKAFGTYGAFVAGSEALIETLIQYARSYIYTTALPPAVAVASSASLRLVESEHWRRDKLSQLIARFRESAMQIGLQLMDSKTPIQPLLLGDDRQVLDMAAQLRHKGFMVGAIRPPTVPEGQSRLRITLTANHSEEQIDALVDALDSCR